MPVKICQQVYDHVAKNDKFHLLYPTRHFGSLVFYACLEENDSEVDKLLDYFGRIEKSALVVLPTLLLISILLFSLEAAIDLIRLKNVVAGADSGEIQDDYTLVEVHLVGAYSYWRAYTGTNPLHSRNTWWLGRTRRMKDFLIWRNS
jgi:Mitochondrial 28S ribosomal protein S22